MARFHRALDVRRTPEQSRSRDRVRSLLDTAAEQLRHHGVDQLTVSAIAASAGMSKAAFYRYFPNKAALLRALAQRAFSVQRERLLALESRPEPTRDLLTAALVGYLNEHRADPFLVQLRSAIRADPELSALDFQDSRENADILTDFLVSRGVEPAEGRLADRVLLVIELLDGLVRTLSVVDDSLGSDAADRLVEEFVDMALGSITIPD